MSNRKVQKKKPETDYYTLFNDYLLKLFSVIRENTDDFETRIAKAYKKYCDTEVDTYIDYTLGKLRPHMKLVIQEDSFLFSNEYSKDSMKLLSGLDFKLFWDQLEERYEAREEIWGLIQNLYVSGSFVLGVGTRDPIVKQILRNAQEKQYLEEQVDKDLQNEEKKTAKKAGQNLMGGLGDLFSNLAKAGAGNELNNLNTDGGVGAMPSMESLEQLFSEDNLLVKLTKEVGNEMMNSNDFKNLGIDPKQQVENPMEAINMLFGPDSNKLQNLVQMFGERLEKKMQEKNLSTGDIQKATTQIGQKVIDQFAGIMPGMPDISGLNPQKMQNMSREEREHLQAEMQQKLFDGLTQGMSQGEKEKFAEMNQYMFESIEKGENRNAEAMQEIMMTAWEEAKVKHLESIGGIEIEDPESELDQELMNTLVNVTPVAKKGDHCYIVCGEAIMKISNTAWDNFMTNCKDQSSEISKYIDHDWIRREIGLSNHRESEAPFTEDDYDEVSEAPFMGDDCEIDEDEEDEEDEEEPANNS